MPESLKFHENIIIGGGPAGSAAAILLAQAGRDVAVLEKQAGPHDKVCGEFLSWEACNYINKLGVNLKILGAQPIHHARLHDGKKSFEFQLPFSAWSLSRRVLDQALLQQVQAAGTVLYSGSNVTNVKSEQGGWAIQTSQGDVRLCRNILFANGKHDIRGWPRNGPNSNLLGFKMHFRLSEIQTKRLAGYTELFLFNGGYAGLQLIEDDKANLCFLIRKHLYAECGNRWGKLVPWLKGISPYLYQRLDGSVPLWQRPLAISGIPYGYFQKATDVRADLFALGDQIAVIPSFAGDGISLALHSAFRAAQSILSETNSAQYHDRVKKDFKSPLRNAQFAACFASHEITRNLSFKLLEFLPSVAVSISRSLRLKKRDLVSEPLGPTRA